jgi:hypothetical protein
MKFNFSLFILFAFATNALSQGFGSMSPPMHHVYSPVNYERTLAIKSPFIYTITLKNDSIFTGIGEILEMDNMSILKINIGSRSLTVQPNETRKISRAKIDVEEIGVPFESVWYFPISKGKIIGYVENEEDDMFFMKAIQSGNGGPILPLTQANLEALIGNKSTPSIKRKIRRGKLWRAVKEYNKL